MIYLVLCYGTDAAPEWRAYTTFRDAARSYIEAGDSQAWRLVTMCKLDVTVPFEPKITIIESVAR